MTYTDETVRADHPVEETFVPRYARGKRAKKGVRTWMILAPIGAVVALGGVAALAMGGPAEQAPLVADEALPMPRTLPSAAAPLESSTAPGALSSAPVVREAPPAPPPPVQRRQAASAPRAEAAPRVVPEPEVSVPEAALTVQPPVAAAPVPAPAIQPTPLD